MRKKLILSLSVAILLFSCSRDELFSPKINDSLIREELFSDIRVVKNNILFANIPGMSGSYATKSSDDAEMVSLNSLLDWAKVDTCHFKGKIITQVAFLPDDGKEAISLIDTLREELLGGDISVAKKFLVKVESRSAPKEIFVATMIPTAEYLKMFGSDDFSFIDKSTFEGIVIFSKLDGSFSDIYVYGNGPMSYGVLMNEDNARKYEQVLYLRLMRKTMNTKSEYEVVDGGEIEGSVCIGYSKVDDRKFPNLSDMFDKSELMYFQHNNCGGGGGGRIIGPDEEDKTNHSLNDTLEASKIVDFKKDPILYLVSLYTSGDGLVTGSGMYPKNKFVFCNALPAQGSRFDRWTGDLYRKTENVCLLVCSDVSSTAYFRNLIEEPGLAIRPCIDLKKGIGNPLIMMEVASTGGASGLKGGTYGNVRYKEGGGKKFHSGIDLAASIGTEVFAMIDGIIDEIGKNPKMYVTEQPNRDRDSGEFPISYKGEKNGAGNRINIVGNIDGKDVKIGYWHLRAKDPVAINPRTGKPFAPGDKVYRGEVLCYTGITGNAYNVPNPHLHLSYYEKNKNGRYVYVNPEKLINGKVNWNERANRILSGAISGIICDSEEQDLKWF